MEGLGTDSGEARKTLFRRLLTENGDKIFSFALTLTNNEDKASELVAEAFSRAWKAFARYDAAKPFHSWVFKIAQNIHIDFKRRLETRMTVALDEPHPMEEGRRAAEEVHAKEEPGLDEALLAEESRDAVRRSLEKVPETFREPMVLCDMMNMNYEEIAAILKVPLGTVRSRIFRGRRIFKDLLEPYLCQGDPV